MTGGTDIWEKSQVALFGLHRTLDEFEQMGEDDQAWAIATWRTRQQLRAIEALERYRKRSKLVKLLFHVTNAGLS